jgi:hypothetical protein
MHIVLCPVMFGIYDSIVQLVDNREWISISWGCLEYEYHFLFFCFLVRVVIDVVCLRRIGMRQVYVP